MGEAEIAQGGLLEGLELGPVVCARPGLSVRNATAPDGRELLVAQIDGSPSADAAEVFGNIVRYAVLSHLPIERSDSRVVIANTTSAGAVSHLPALGWRLGQRLEVFEKVVSLVQEFHRAGHTVGTLDPDYILFDDDLDPFMVGPHFSPLVGPYAAPEANEGSGPLDQGSDLYSLGRLLHFILAGNQPPAVYDDPAKLLDLINFPAGLSRIIRKAVRRSPGARYQTIDEFVTDLSRYERYQEVGVAHEEVEERNFGRLSFQPVRGKPVEAPKEKAGAPLAVQQLGKVVDLTNVTPFKLRRGTRFILFFFGGLSLLMAVVISYFGGVSESVRITSMLAAALTGFALFSPGIEREQLVRTAFAICFASVVYGANPTRHLAKIADLAGLRSASPQTRAKSFKSLSRRGRIGFQGVDLSETDLRQHGFEGADLQDASFENADLSETLFFSANLSGARFRDADIGGAVFNFTSVDFATDFELARCDETTRFPEGWSCVDGHPLKGVQARLDVD